MKTKNEIDNKSLSKKEMKKVLKIIEMRNPTEEDIQRFTKFIETKNGGLSNEDIKQIAEVIGADNALTCIEGLSRVTTVALLPLLYGLKFCPLKVALASAGLASIAVSLVANRIRKKSEEDVDEAYKNKKALVREYFQYQDINKEIIDNITV